MSRPHTWTVLFVCSQKRLRSPTAEQVFSRCGDLEVNSAGTNHDAENPLTAELVAWADLGGAIQTIIEVGEATTPADIVADAFAGATLSVGERFEVEMHQQGLLRPLAAAELSDGTLRYILLAAALLSPRPPELMILNEPEASLHPDLLPPLARLMVKVAERCQLVVVSHALPLVDALAREGSTLVSLEKQLGETVIRETEPPDWKWPGR